MKLVLKIVIVLFFVSPLHAQENNINLFSISDGLASNTINDVLQDHIGYLWLATDKGYTQFDGVNFKNYPNNKANCIFNDDDKLYIGLKNGLLLIRNHKPSFFKSKEVLKIRKIHNKIILATTEGVCELKKEYIQPIRINTTVDFAIINDIISFENKIYIGCNKGLWHIDVLYKPKKTHQLSNNNFTSLLKNNHTLLAGTLSNGVKVITKNNIVKNISTIAQIKTLQKIDNEIWVGSSDNGIEILDATKFTFKRLINKYNTSISNKVTAIFNNSAIWVGSAKNGLYKINLTNKTHLVKPKVFLENISVNYKALDSLTTNKLQLTSNENNISFTYKSIHLNNPEKTQYQYQLNTQTSPWAYKNSVDFANLKPGNYTFSVWSKNGSLISKKESFVFHIDAPFYEKHSFIIAVVSILFLLMALFIDIKLKRLKKRKNKEIIQLKQEKHLLSLEQKALQLQMNPHFIFNVLNGIKALGNTGDSLELNKTISQFSILLRSVLNNSRLEEISLSEEINTLKNYLDLEQKMSATTFKYHVNAHLNNIDSEEIMIPPMLIQPFVENCVKHAFNLHTKEESIQITFQVKEQFLYFTIEDNGVGYHQSKKNKKDTNHTSLALKVTKERIENLTPKANFTIKEQYINTKVVGTVVSFKIPLKTDY